MARKARIEFAGAVYHVLDRGDRRKAIFRDELDRQRFLEALGEVCGRTGWRVHAYVLLGDHYHLLLETPEPNLVAGMKWLQATYAIRFNGRHRRRGPVFQGRYKAVLVDPAERSYFAILADYIHLNPVRAGLIAPGEKLHAYAWSSWPEYLRDPARRPPWLAVETVLGELGLRDTPAGRRRCSELLQRRALEDRGQPLSPETARQLRRGWCLGSEKFRERMLKLLAKAAPKLAERQPIDGALRRRHTEREAELLVCRALEALGLAEEALGAMKKSDPRKILVGALIRRRTLASNRWIAQRLSMGDPTRVSRSCGQGAVEADPSLSRKLAKLEKMATGKS